MRIAQEGNGVSRCNLQRNASRNSDRSDRRVLEDPEAIGQETSACVRAYEQAFQANVRDFELRMTIRFGLMLFVAWGLVVVVLKVCP